MPVALARVAFFVCDVHMCLFMSHLLAQYEMYFAAPVATETMVSTPMGRNMSALPIWPSHNTHAERSWRCLPRYTIATVIQAGYRPTSIKHSK